MILHILLILVGIVGAFCISAGLYFLPFTPYPQKYIPVSLLSIGFFLAFVAIGHFTGK